MEERGKWRREGRVEEEELKLARDSDMPSRDETKQPPHLPPSNTVSFADAIHID